MNGFQWQHRFLTSQPFILVRYRGYESQPDGPYSLLADPIDQKLASFELWPLACPTTMISTHKERRYSVLLLLYEFLNLGLLVFGKTTIFILINQFLLCFFVAYGSHHLPNPSSAHTSSINEEQVLVALLFKSFLMNRLFYSRSELLSSLRLSPGLDASLLGHCSGVCERIIE